MKRMLNGKYLDDAGNWHDTDGVQPVEVNRPAVVENPVRDEQVDEPKFPEIGETNEILPQ